MLEHELPLPHGVARGRYLVEQPALPGRELQELRGVSQAGPQLGLDRAAHVDHHVVPVVRERVVVRHEQAHGWGLQRRDARHDVRQPDDGDRLAHEASGRAVVEVAGALVVERDDQVRLPAADPGDDLTTERDARHELAVVLVEDLVLLHAELARRGERLDRASAREGLARSRPVPGVAVRQRQELHAVAGQGESCGDATRVLVGLVGVRRDDQDAQPVGEQARNPVRFRWGHRGRGNRSSKRSQTTGMSSRNSWSTRTLVK
ncbi:hypothetical protein D3C74_341200 [compost metagenome]